MAPRSRWFAAWIPCLLVFSLLTGCAGAPPSPRPNILVILSDDQSWLHLGAAGDSLVQTPSIDRLAREGVLFTHAFAASPSCSPSRAALLTGQQVWRLGAAANQFGPLDVEHTVYPDVLGMDGYYVGYTGKGWEPSDVSKTGRSRNPAGDAYNMYGDRSPGENFEAFLDSLPAETPFCFWLGSRYPHRPFDTAPSRSRIPVAEKLTVPPLWPDDVFIRGDLARYIHDVERFDDEVGEAFEALASHGKLGNTLIVVTSDNGMPFPRCKTNLYDLGTRVPLVIWWKDHVPPGRVVDDFVCLTDLAPTFLEAAGRKPTQEMTGRALLPILLSNKSGRIEDDRDFVVTARERHSPSRPGDVSYPSRAIRTYDYLYIRNYEPDRWPEGDPPRYGDVDSWDGGYEAPTKDHMLEREADPYVAPFFNLCFGKRPAEELYDVRHDPYEIVNLLVGRRADSLSTEQDYRKIAKKLAKQLNRYLDETGDPRVTGEPIPWDNLPFP
jgi:arylsulfatase A-like enzyme